MTQFMHLTLLHLFVTLCAFIGGISSGLQNPLGTKTVARAVSSRSGPSNETRHRGMNGTTSLSAAVFSSDSMSTQSLSDDNESGLRVLFLSADTGGGHRASALSLAKQFERHFPGSTYELLDVWSLDGVYPYKALVNSYKHLSANPNQWKLFYHLSNIFPTGVVANLHSGLMCGRKIRRRIASYDPDVVISVHPAMNSAPRIAVRQLNKRFGKHIPFFTVVTDLGTGHSMWFEKNVEKVYVASDRIRRLARRRGFTPKDKIVMTGLPIRHEFAIQAEKMGDRTTESGKKYQMQMRRSLGIQKDKPMVLVMGGGEGVGSLSDIVDELYVKFSLQSVDATICVVCGRNEKLKNELSARDWDAVVAESEKPKKRRRFHRAHRSKQIQAALDRAECAVDSESRGEVDVIGLGFVDNMAEFMVAADVLVSKAGPGTIAEAAAVGLPVMMTSFLPGQESGNVDVVLEAGFGDFCQDPDEIAREVACWLKDDDLLATMSKSAAEVGHPHAAEDIVLDIGNITKAWMDVNIVANSGKRTSVRSAAE